MQAFERARTLGAWAIELDIHFTKDNVAVVHHDPEWILVGDINLKSFARISRERGLGGVVGHYLFMTNSLITQLHERGQKAGSGFLPTRNLFNREWARGVDWVFTNHLPALVKS
jgi:glycerophosphoryl diester phosphodiesterase